MNTAFLLWVTLSHDGLPSCACTAILSAKSGQIKGSKRFLRCLCFLNVPQIHGHYSYIVFWYGRRGHVNKQSGIPHGFRPSSDPPPIPALSRLPISQESQTRDLCRHRTY